MVVLVVEAVVFGPAPPSERFPPVEEEEAGGGGTPVPPVAPGGGDCIINCLCPALFAFFERNMLCEC